MRVIGAAVVAAGLCALPTPSGARQPLSSADAEAAIRDAEDRVQSFSVTIKTKQAVTLPGRPELLPPLAIDYVVTMERGGKFVCDIRGQARAVGGKAMGETHRRAAFNGTQYKEEWGSPTNPWRGVIDSAPRGLSWGVKPTDYTTTYLGLRPSDLFREAGGTTVGSASVQGVKVVIVETKERVGEDQHKRKCYVAVDPGRGFAMLKKASLRFIPGAGRWESYHEMECSGFVRDESGVWLPTTAKAVSYEIEPDGSKSVSHQVDAALSNWVVNPKVPPAAYELKFRAGIMIEDRVTGKTFQTVDSSKHPHEQSVLTGIEIYNQDEPQVGSGLPGRTRGPHVGGARQELVGDGGRHDGPRGRAGCDVYGCTVSSGLGVVKRNGSGFSFRPTRKEGSNRSIKFVSSRMAIA